MAKGIDKRSRGREPPALGLSIFTLTTSLELIICTSLFPMDLRHDRTAVLCGSFPLHDFYSHLTIERRHHRLRHTIHAKGTTGEELNGLEPFRGAIVTIRR